MASLTGLGFYVYSETKTALPNEAQLLLNQAAAHSAKAKQTLHVLTPQDSHTLSETLAQTIFRELAKFPENQSEFQQALLKCAAKFQYQLHPERKTCVNNPVGEPDYACMQKRGWGRHDLRQILYAQTIDLNSDGIDDYIVSDRYFCEELSVNSGSVYFVLLSDGKKSHHLAYAEWAIAYLEARRKPGSQQLALTEVLERDYGKFTRFYDFDPNTQRFQQSFCIVENRAGKRLCDPDIADKRR